MTDPERFERVRVLFVAASERAVDSRHAWLESQCADDLELRREVEDLLARSEAAERAGERLESGDARGAGSGGRRGAFSNLVRGSDSLAQAHELGDYEILHVIGVGGMGTVYAAEQKHPRRRVALKVLREGLLSEPARRRFEYEAELLGRLRHPGIAHIYEAGVADAGLGPQPFLAMELVEGRPLSDWVVEFEPNLPRKLALFTDLCGAVQHAHERGVIHRDLKPDNILVEKDGKPKVLDFGIARAVGTEVGVATRLTEAGAIIGTLPYMSPERLAGDPDAIDTRSDVYALGVILYELITGRRPHKVEGLAIGKAIEMIRLGNAASLSADAEVPRDLALIVAKAIDADPARRYASAAALADDVQRFLRDEMITARPASTLYQIRKLVRRHRAFAIGSGAVLGMLLLGLAGTLWQARNAESRRQEAEHEKIVAQDQRAKADENAADTKLVADFQASILADVSVDELGHSLIVELRNELRESLSRLGRDPAEIASTLARFDDAVRPANPTTVAQRVLEARVFEPAIANIGKQYASKPTLAAMLDTPLANTLLNLGLYELGVRAARQAVDARRAALGNDDLETLTSIDNLARLLLEHGQPDEAEPLAREALAGRRTRLGESDPDLLTSLSNLASVLNAQGKLDDAEALYREALARCRVGLGVQHRTTLASLNNLAMLLQDRGDLSEAEPLYREALAGFRATRGDGDPDTLQLMDNFGFLLQAQDKLAEAEPLYREALAGIRVKLGDEHPQTLAFINNLAGACYTEGKLVEAESLQREALAGRRAKLGDRHPATLESMNNLALVLEAQGKAAEAEPLYREVLAGRRATFGDAHAATLVSINNLAMLLQAQGRLAEAEPLDREALVGARATLGDTHPLTLTFAHNLALLHFRQGDLAQAEALYREALAGRRARLGEAHSDTLDSQESLALVLQTRGEMAEAAALFEQALEIARKRPPTESEPFVRKMQDRLRTVYRAWHKIDPASGHDRQADEIDKLIGTH
jgi:non-specific serine/threonine protein kinase/serine/threonine-protein kinase